MTSTTYFVIATGEPSDEDDVSIPGVYEFEVPEGIQPENHASAVLDAFHSEIGISTLDDFTFEVQDDKGAVVYEPEDAESYALKDTAVYVGKTDLPSVTGLSK